MSRPRARIQDLQGARKARDLLQPATPAQFLDDDGQPARSFGQATTIGWADDPVLDAIPDAEDLVDAIGRNPAKIRAADNTPAKVRTRLTAEIKEAKDRREKRERPAVEEPPGRTTRRGR